MAWTAGTFPTRIRAVSGLGFKGEPYTLHGYLEQNETHEEGDVLVRDATNGTLIGATATEPNGTIIGVLPSVSPRTGSQRPQPTGPNPRTKVTLDTVPDFQRYDVDKSIVFYVWTSGNIFIGHVVDEEATDDTADDIVMIYTPLEVSFTAPRYNFATDATAGTPVEACRATGFVNPQPHSFTGIGGGSGSATPGPVINARGAATGTTNPLMTVLPTAGIFF